MYNVGMYIFYAILYATFIGFYEVFKKLARIKSHTSTILVMFTSVCFLLSLMWIPMGVAVPPSFIPIFALKGLMLAFSWFILLKILRDADISIVSATQIFSIIMTFVAGLTIFNETASFFQIAGIVIIATGITLMSLLNKKEKGKIRPLYIVLLLISATIASVSGMIDKYTTTYLSNFQVQFWFLLFVFIFSWVFFGIECIRKKEFLIKNQDLKNYWIYLVGIFLFVGDVMLFLSYKSPNSQMIIISILSKLKMIIAVFSGIIIFKEKNIILKILLTLLILLGVILVAAF